MAEKVQKTYLLTLWLIDKVVFILFVITLGAQTIGNTTVYGFAKQLVIELMGWTANPTQFWSFGHDMCFF